MGYSRKNPNKRVEAMEFIGVLRNSMWKFQVSFKKRIGISRGALKNLTWNFDGSCLLVSDLSSDVSRVFLGGYRVEQEIWGCDAPGSSEDLVH